MFNSRKYWEERYKKNMNSGCGSYNHLALFKSKVINDFLDEHHIQSIIDYGVGDGNQLKTLNTDNREYIGIDVSKTVIDKCKQLFANKTFILDTEIRNHLSDVVLSCDVIYHLVEDNVYTNYMTNLFTMSRKYVIIYAKDADIRHTQHVRFRKFTNYIQKNFPKWQLIHHIPNKYPQVVIGKDNEKTSPSDFYIYENFQEQQKICSDWSTYIEKNLLPLIHKDLEGNIYSKHHSKHEYSNLSPKRYNIINLFKEIKPKRVLEIGFNAGFSSLLMKMSWGDFDIVCVDINEHDYVVPCFNQICQNFDKMDIILKPSQEALCDLIKRKELFDIIHIDGDHSLEGARRDLELCLKISHEKTVIIFDDTNLKHLSDLCNLFVKNNKLKRFRLHNFVECREYKHDFYQVCH